MVLGESVRILAMLSRASQSIARRSYVYPAIFLCAYLAMYSLMMPGFVITHLDDFGYYDGLVRTLNTGRLQAGQWLGPYAAGLTAVSAAVYLATENFYASTFGVLAAFATANFVLLYLLLRARTSPFAAAVGAFLSATFPIYLRKSLEYTSVAPSVTLFLAALLLFERRRYVWFFVVAIVGFATRQNLGVLLVMPVYALLFDRQRTRKDMLTVAIGMALFAGAAAAFVNYMGETYVQHHVVNRAFEGLEAVPYLIAVLTGLLIYVAALSLANVL
jgi:hypothetical protein